MLFGLSGPLAYVSLATPKVGPRVDKGHVKVTDNTRQDRHELQASRVIIEVSELGGR